MRPSAVRGSRRATRARSAAPAKPWQARLSNGRPAREGPGWVSCGGDQFVAPDSLAAIRSYPRKRRSRTGICAIAGRRPAGQCASVRARRSLGRFARVATLIADRARRASGCSPRCGRSPPRTCRSERALGRVLAEDVAAAIDVPPFDSSAMDGFALVAGAAAELPVVGESRAGQPVGGALSSRAQAMRISTGAAVPEGADAVVPVERTEAARRARARAGRREPAPTCGTRARTCAPGEVVIRAGTRAGAGRDRRGGVARARGAALRAAAARGARRDRRRAARSPASRSARPDLQLERATCSRALVERAGAELDRRATRPRRPRRRTARRLAERARRGRRGRASRAASRSARTTTSSRALARARGRGALLGRAPAARQADLVRRARRHARLRPARQPGVGDGHLPAVRAPGAARARRAPTRAPRRASAVLDEDVRRNPERDAGGALPARRRRRRLARGADRAAGLARADLDARRRTRWRWCPRARARSRPGERVEVELAVRQRDPRRPARALHRRAPARVQIVHVPRSPTTRPTAASARSRRPR